MLPGLLSASAWFGLFLAGQLAAFRFLAVRHRSKLIVRLLAAALAGHVATIASLSLGGYAAPAYSPFLSVVCGVLLIMCLFILYMPFFYTLTTSLSVETLAMLAAAKGHRLSLQQVKHRFTSDAFVLDRLETMRANGYFIADAGTYALTPRGARVARALRTVKQALMLGAGG